MTDPALTSAERRRLARLARRFAGVTFTDRDAAAHLDMAIADVHELMAAVVAAGGGRGWQAMLAAGPRSFYDLDAGAVDVLTGRAALIANLGRDLETATRRGWTSVAARLRQDLHAVTSPEWRP